MPQKVLHHRFDLAPDLQPVDEHSRAKPHRIGHEVKPVRQLPRTRPRRQRYRCNLSGCADLSRIWRAFCFVQSSPRLGRRSCNGGDEYGRQGKRFSRLRHPTGGAGPAQTSTLGARQAHRIAKRHAYGRLPVAVTAKNTGPTPPISIDQATLMAQPRSFVRNWPVFTG